MIGKRILTPAYIGLFLLLFSVSTASAQGGLVAYYPLDGDETDQSNNENHGLQYGGIEYSDGVIGKAALFDGSVTYIGVFHSAELNLKDEFTISLYAKPDPTNGIHEGDVYDTPNGAPTLVSKDGRLDPTGPYNLYMGAANPSDASMGQVIDFEIQNNVDTFENQSVEWPIIDPDTFHHIVWRHYGDVYEIWVDGYLALSVNSTFEPDSKTGNLLIGRRGWHNGYFKGTIDEVKMYDYAISPERIRVQAGLLGPIRGAGDGTGEYYSLLYNETAHIEVNKKQIDDPEPPAFNMTEEDEEVVPETPGAPRERAPDGICGPSAVLGLAVVPLIIHRSKKAWEIDPQQKQ